ncbi:hypothetical protein RD792_010375 [Penstemon davidsonii]|uniref:Co-chaperone protein p23 n=1 Tax=Penstemon davidsonii TaxID=160366 RepID=A0ABR0D1N8_9LAMI|nr:hypothetical protein RD792_010375 [Penstemon davidsonii]
MPPAWPPVPAACQPGPLPDCQGPLLGPSTLLLSSVPFVRNLTLGSLVTHFLRQGSRHPEVKWAEREDKVYLTVLLPDAKNPKVNLDPEGTFTFSATAGADNNLYEIKLDLFDKVDVEESKINIGVRNIFCVLEKAEPKWWTKLLRGDEKTPHYVKVDWDKWVDEDDETGAATKVISMMRKKRAESLEIFQEPSHLKLPGVVYAIVGPIYGILCVVSMDWHVALWNPATGRMREVPPIPKQFSCIRQIGFGVEGDNYKIVIMSVGDDGFMCSHYAVYTSRNNIWRYVEKERHLENCELMELRCATTFSNGCYYWIKRIDGVPELILSFDFSTESFGVVEFPCRCSYYGGLGLYGDNDSLVLFSGPVLDEEEEEGSDSEDDGGANGAVIFIWVLNNGNWTQMFTVNCPLDLGIPLGFWNNRYLILTNWLGNELQSYDLELNESRNFRVYMDESVRAGAHRVKFYNYKESLYSVKEDGLEDYDCESATARKYFG